MDVTLSVHMLTCSVHMSYTVHTSQPCVHAIHPLCTSHTLCTCHMPCVHTCSVHVMCSARITHSAHVNALCTGHTLCAHVIPSVCMSMLCTCHMLCAHVTRSVHTSHALCSNSGWCHTPYRNLGFSESLLASHRAIWVWLQNGCDRSGVYAVSRPSRSLLGLGGVGRAS